MTRLFCGNLPFTATAQQLGTLCQGIVPVKSVQIESFHGRSRGYGFVETTNPEDATKLISALNSYSLDGRTLVVQHAKEKGASPIQSSPQDRPSFRARRPPRNFGRFRRGSRGGARGRSSVGVDRRKQGRQREPQKYDFSSLESKTRLFIGNLPWSIDEKEIRAVFEGCGVESVEIARTRKGWPLGFGHVQFENSDGMENALRIGVNLMMEGRQIRCEAAVEKEKKN